MEINKRNRLILEEALANNDFKKCKELKYFNTFELPDIQNINKCLQAIAIKTDNIEEHKMHSEWFTINEETATALNKAKSEGKEIIAVGTTSVRVLESATDINGKLKPKSGETTIFIYPSYDWKFVDHMLTNFHLPKSTLLMLISSFASKELIERAYQEAIREKYRFFSFGDSMLII